eukprot:TRINITY_DN907_c0_g1_i5.p1 TRINITY_DN907_c0_g1~~TRINITY_DN907_c0_g1_i5.p1  ORF type:complete len:684 (+),score=148.76 TRINITY_DN907_c0_g1_i5:329-2380(+)
MRLLEVVDVRANKIAQMPDLSNLTLLTELCCRDNNLVNLDFGLIGIRHILELDVSQNNISEIPQNVSRLVYLHDLDISGNKLETIPITICELLSCRKLNLDSNPIVEPPEKIWKQGLEAIRTFYNWEKPTGVLSKMITRDDVCTGDSNPIGSPSSAQRLTKSLSVKEKRALLFKKRTHQEFDESGLKELRHKFGAADISAFLQVDMNSVHSQKTQGKHTASSTELYQTLIAQGIPGYDVERPGTLSPEIALNHFSFKPYYHSDFYDQPHFNFLGVSKTDGYTIITVTEYSGGESLEGDRSSRGRSKSLAVIGRSLMTKKNSHTSNRRRVASSICETPQETLSGKESIDESSERGKRKSLGKKSSSRFLNLETTSTSELRESRASDLRESRASDLRESRPSVQITPVTNSLTASTPAQKDLCKVLVRSSKEDRMFYIPGEKMSKGPKACLKYLKDHYPEYSGIQFKIHKNVNLNEELLKVEMRLMVKGYKFGILYATKNNKTEDDFYLNVQEGEDLKEFCSWIGDHIDLTGWDGYDAGLDLETGSTGKQSIFTNFESYNIMFHVSTMIPFTEDDPQQLARKRHLGNDVIVILFQEEGVDWVFDPSIVHSYFNHVFVVIRKDHEESKLRGNTMYRIAVTFKNGVQDFGPAIPASSLIEKSKEGREFLLTKCMMFYSISYLFPSFS